MVSLSRKSKGKPIRRTLPPEEGAEVVLREGAGPFVAAQVRNGSLVVIETGDGQYCVVPEGSVK